MTVPQTSSAYSQLYELVTTPVTAGRPDYMAPVQDAASQHVSMLRCPKFDFAALTELEQQEYGVLVTKGVVRCSTTEKTRLNDLFNKTVRSERNESR